MEDLTKSIKNNFIYFIVGMIFGISIVIVLAFDKLFLEC